MPVAPYLAKARFGGGGQGIGSYEQFFKYNNYHFLCKSLLYTHFPTSIHVSNLLKLYFLHVFLDDKICKRLLHT